MSSAESIGVTCPSCDKENRSDATFCYACGTRLEQSVPPPPARALPVTGEGRYIARTFLGEGGRKQVFRAIDTRLDREVALSLIRTTGLDAASIERVRREARAMAKLGDHPNIVNIFDVGDEEGAIFLVAELMKGGSVEDLLNNSNGRPLPLEKVIAIARNIGSALQYVHEQEIVHRDIKPANVWLSRNGTAKLGDFGLASATRSSKLTSEGMMLGTVAYMAPEQATGGAVDARSDLYSFGALLYEIATGKPPFAGDDAIAIVSQQINTAPVAPTWHNPEIPAGLEQLILELLSKAPGGRPQTAAEVLTRLEQIGGDRSTSADRPAPPVQDNPLDRLAGGVFVGREAETQQLRYMFDEARKGSGGISLLVGEPGIGKTRMSEELITYARMAGAQILTGRCYEGEGAPAYWPWIQVIRSSVYDRPAQALASEMGSGAAHIAQIVSDVGDLLPDLPSPSTADPESSRFQLFDSVTTFLRNASRSRPLVVFLDDMHWADKSSLLLFEFFSRQLRDSRIHVICTYRDIELGRRHPLAQTLATVIREPNTQRILLRGLTQTDVARYIKLTAGIEPPESLVTSVSRETEGNPFFISETVRLLAAEGRLEDTSEHSWSRTIPQGVKEVIGRRLDQLSDDCNQVLTLASVLGREFEPALIELLSNIAGEALLEALDEAVAARVITMESTGRYRFAHALIRETLYKELSTARRLRLHKTAAEALEKLSGEDPDRHLSELAHHYFEAASLGGVEKAILYARRAGERAMRQLAYDEAAVQFVRAIQALDLAEQDDASSRGELLLAQGNAEISSGDTRAALKTYKAAFQLAKDGGLNELLARAALGVGDVLTDVGAVNQELVDVLESASAAISDRDSALRVRVLARLGEALRFDEATKHREAELSDQALEMARRLGDPRAIAQALYGRIIALGEESERAFQIELATELIETAAQAGDVERRLLGLRLRMIFYFFLGKTEDARRDVEEYARLAEKSKLPLYSWFSPLYESTWSLAEGRLEETASLIQRALAEGIKAGEPNVMNFTAGAVLSLAYEQEDDERMRQVASQSAEPRIFHWYWGAAIFANMAVGQVVEARRMLSSASVDGFRTVNTDFGLLWMLGLTAEVCRMLDDAGSSEALYELGLPYGDYFGIPGYLAGTNGIGHHHLGVLATTMKRYGEAQAHLQTALEVHESAGFDYLAARTRLALARLHQLRGDPGDAELSQGFLNRVIDASSRGSFSRTLRDALELRLKLQGVESVDAGKSIHAIAAEVQAERPSLGSQASPDGTVTILFTDIEGSTELTERLGDQRWFSLLSVHDRIIREQVANAGGTVVKSRGDGFMLAFPSARHALTSAIEMQRALARHNREAPTATPIRIRIGAHTGEVVKHSGDFFGRHVNYASRIADRAAGGEILVSELTKALLQGSPEFRFGPARTGPLKGFPGTHPMYVLDWSAGPSAPSA